jgi:recombination protein RecA
MGIIRKSGAFYSYGDLRLGQGRENARDYLKQNQTVSDEIERQIRSNSGLVRTSALAAAAVAEVEE